MARSLPGSSKRAKEIIMISQNTWRGWVSLIAILIMGATISQAADVRDFQAFNNTGRQIKSLKVSAHESEVWGPNVLGLQVLPNGYQTTISFNPQVPTSCWYDFKLIFA